MSDWANEMETATAVAEQMQAAEAVAESRFDEVHARAQAAGDLAQLRSTGEFHEWMAARQATDAAWGTWSQVMDNKPQS